VSYDIQAKKIREIGRTIFVSKTFARGCFTKEILKRLSKTRGILIQNTERKEDTPSWSVNSRGDMGETGVFLGSVGLRTRIY